MIKDLTGMRFGRLAVMGLGETKVSPKGKKTPLWKCKCDCGNEISVTYSHLTLNHTKSCGCLRDEQRRTSHTVHGLSHSRIDEIYKSIKERCYNPRCKAYYRYGGRGIKMCDEWLHDKQAFFEWAFKNGYQNDLSIDRINNDGDYEPNNCRWTTAKEQANNTSKNRRISFNGEEHTLSEWQDIVGISQKTIGYRIRSNWSIEDALTIPPSFKNGSMKARTT